MSELGPLEPIDPQSVRPPRRDRMWWMAGVSVALHLVVVGLLILPQLPLAEAAPPPPVNVDIVTPSQLASLELSAASEAPSSVPASSEQSSSQAPSSQAASKAEPSKPPASQPPSSEPASSQSISTQPVSSEESASAATSAASSGPPPSGASSASASSASSAQPASRPIVVPVSPDESSADTASSNADSSGEASTANTSTTSEASDGTASASARADTITSILTASGGAGGADNASAEAASAPSAELPKPAPLPKPVGGGALHVAKDFYLKQMLKAPELSQAKASLKQLSPERRLAQTCNIEAYGQAGHAGYSPDAIIANAFAPPAIAGTTYTVTGGAFRSDGSWYRIAYQCTLSKDMGSVASFAFHIGADVTQTMTARLGGG